MAVLFFSGFETGDLSEWPGSSGGAFSAGTATVNGGKYALTATNLTSFLNSATFTGQTTLYMRAYMQLARIEREYHRRLARGQRIFSVSPGAPPPPPPALRNNPLIASLGKMINRQ
jgi:hypothetical protein